jgi:hypothetical protein
MALKLDKYTYFEKIPKKENIDVFYTSDMKEEMELYGEMNLEIFSWQNAEKFLNLNTDYNKLIEAYAKKNNLKNIAILAAHTKKIKDSWFYFNEDSGSSVQRWINSVDGKYKALILFSCNPEENEIHSKKSPIITPENFPGRYIYNERIPISLYLPRKGNIDSYLIEEELRKLK